MSITDLADATPQKQRGVFYANRTSTDIHSKIELFLLLTITDLLRLPFYFRRYCEWWLDYFQAARGMGGHPVKIEAFFQRIKHMSYSSKVNLATFNLESGVPTNTESKYRLGLMNSKTCALGEMPIV